MTCSRLFFLVCTLALGAAQAQTSGVTMPAPGASTPMPASVSASAPSQADRDAMGRDLETRRSALDTAYKNTLRQCYQLFDVTDCRMHAREDYLRASKTLRQEELAYDAQERRIKAAEARQRLADKQAQAHERVEDAQQAQQDARERAQRNADKQAEFAATPSQRSAYEQKQRDAAEHRDSVERRAHDRDKSRAAPLPPPETKP